MAKTDLFGRMFVLATVLLLGACAHQESYDLRTYLSETAKVRYEAEHAFEDALPLLQQNCAGDDGASRMTDADAAQIASVMAMAILEATGKPVTRIILVRPEEANRMVIGGLDGSLNPGCDRCRIGTSFTKALADRHESTVMNALGQSAASKLRYRVNSALDGACEPGVREAVFYTLAYATELPHDPRWNYGFEAMVQHLPYAVPLGEKVDEPGAWYVKVRR